MKSESQAESVAQVLWLSVVVACGAGVALGAITLLYDFYLDPSITVFHYKHPRFVLPPLAAVTTLFFLVQFVILAPLTLLVGRISRIGPAQGSLAIALLVSGTYAFAIWLPVLRYSKWVQEWQIPLLVGILAILFALAYAARRGWFVRAGRAAGMLVPVALLAFGAVVWVLRYRAEDLTSGRIGLGLVLLAIALGGLFALCYLVPARRAASIVQPLAFLIVILSPVADWAGNALSRGIKIGATTTGHSVPRVFLLTLDTLRADALSCYNPDAPPTPNIDALAADGVRFSKAFSASPWTIPSFASIFTGVAPGVHLTNGFGRRIPSRLMTLAERLREAGYFTSGTVMNSLLDSNRGFDRGFIDYEVYPAADPGESLGALLIKRFFPDFYARVSETHEVAAFTAKIFERNAARDFFIWHHFMDPHMPYSPPEAYRPQREPPDGHSYHFWAPADWTGNDATGRVRGEGGKPRPEEIEWIRELYLAEVRYVDDNVGRLIDKLKELDLYDDSLIIFTSDHGEEFGEHGLFSHGYSLYNSAIHMPLIIKMPGSTSTGVVEEVVSTESITPTVLDILGIRFDSADFNSPSLARLTANPASDTGTGTGRAFSSGVIGPPKYKQESVVFGSMKLIRPLTRQGARLFDLDADWGEQNPLTGSGETKAEAERLLAEQNERIEKTNERLGSGEGETFELDAEAIRILKDLGYMD